MKKEFNVKDTINFPSNLIETSVDDYWVIVAPKYPNWIVLDNDEMEIFQALKNGATILQAMENYIKKNECEDNIAIDLMTKFLGKIEDVTFYADAEFQKEIPVEKIDKLVHINLTNNCNLRCAHCYMAAGIGPSHYLSIGKIIETVKQINEINGKSDIVISGGEPLMVPDIFDLLKALSDNKITLFTNGTLINEQNYKLICDCCDEIQISFEGITPKKYELIRGIGNFERVINAISLLKSQEIRIILAITILPMTIDDIKENLIDFIKNLEYKNIEVRLNNEIEMTGNAVTMDMSNYSQEYADRVILDLMKQLQKMNATVDFPTERNVRFTNCGIGTNIVINYDGKIYPCHKFSYLHYDMNSDMRKIFSKFNEINRETSNDNIAKCRECELRYICSGGCKIDNYNRTGDMMIPICNEEYKKKQYRKLLFEYLRG